MAIKRGDLVEVTTASETLVTMRALGGREMGRDFPVIWVCTEDEWGYDEPDAIPWPASHVKLLEPA